MLDELEDAAQAVQAGAIQPQGLLRVASTMQYYPAGSLKARSCVAGNRLLYGALLALDRDAIYALPGLHSDPLFDALYGERDEQRYCERFDARSRRPSPAGWTNTGWTNRMAAHSRRVRPHPAAHILNAARISSEVWTRPKTLTDPLRRTSAPALAAPTKPRLSSCRQDQNEQLPQKTPSVTQ